MASFSTDDVERALAALVGDGVFQRLHVSEFRPEFGEDRNGEPALWIYVLIPDEAPPELAGGPHFEERQRIREALQAAGWDGPVYARFRRVSEDLSARRSAITK
jgi:hypothetical protein